jgi:hypothetical protein
MPHARPLLIAGVTSIALVLVNMAPPVIGLGSHPAFAKNDKDEKEDKGDRGNGHDKSSASDDSERGNGRANGHSRGDDDSGVEQSQSASLEPPAKGKSAAPGQNKPRDVVAPDVAVAATKPNNAPHMASLNAAGANLQAFIHASPNSKVGLLAAYAQATVALEAAIAARDSGEVGGSEEAMDNFAAAKATYDASVMYLTSMYSYPDTSDAALMAERIALSEAIATATDPMLIAILENHIAAIDDVLAASAELAEAQLALDESQGDADALVAEAELAVAQSLNAAAGVPVDAATKAWVDAQLQASGVFDYFRLQATAPAP